LLLAEVTHLRGVGNEQSQHATRQAECLHGEQRRDQHDEVDTDTHPETEPPVATIRVEK